jgi:hypothetical protein
MQLACRKRAKRGSRRRVQNDLPDCTAARAIGLGFGSRVGIRNIEVIDIAGPLGIFVQDHIIIRKNGHACIKGLKLI